MPTGLNPSYGKYGFIFLTCVCFMLIGAAGCYTIQALVKMETTCPIKTLLVKIADGTCENKLHYTGCFLLPEYSFILSEITLIFFTVSSLITSIFFPCVRWVFTSPASSNGAQLLVFL